MTRKQTKHWTALALLLALASGCGETHTPAEFQEMVQGSRLCAAEGETCVLAGSSRCTCAVPVSASRAAEVEEFADTVDCGNVVVDCPRFGNLRCEGGLCTADIL